MRLLWIALTLLTLLSAAPDPAGASELRIQRALTVCTVQSPGASTELLGDLFQPPAGPHHRRALLLVHGGGWSTGSRADYEPLARNLARLGFTALSVDYRLAPLATHPAQLQDLHCALRWLHSKAEAWDVEPRRVAVIGGSAGAHLAALLAYGGGAPLPLAAAVLHGGPHDLSVLTTVSREAQGTVHALLGTTTPTPRQLQEASPVHYVRQGAVPTLILHGERDPQVPLDQAQRLARALQRVQVPHQLLVIPGAGHADFGRDPDAVGRALLNFLSATLN